MDTISQTDTTEILPQQSPAGPQQPELAPKRKLNWKGFVFGIIVVIIIEIFAVNALKSDNKQNSSIFPTPAVTKTKSMNNWKTYSGVTDKQTFNFRYPANYLFENGSKDDPNVIEIISPEKMKAFNKCLKNTPVECTKDAIFLETKSFSKQTAEDLDTFLTEHHDDKNYANLEAFKPLIVDGHKAMQGQSAGYRTVRNTFIDLGNRVILVTIMTDDNTYPNMGNRILSTFKFTN